MRAPYQSVFIPPPKCCNRLNRRYTSMTHKARAAATDESDDALNAAIA